eukprot:CAMPEP_0202913176 /NCGR_PEP_ID=MMETSP1392-20130828/59792_1 /ASSEMBLY_ACC=CAM_ASM_000868 /TAXON_ID=225041 /ORGANISM="Chlamydomonas chlamydogama, Strain SAG 11-48b" /LENGTH=86 /DNA_ID=CAMNT_0049604353 /DNA_START=234 /DNA_END=494 /DNA_ORIENTATION=-
MGRFNSKAGIPGGVLGVPPWSTVAAEALSGSDLGSRRVLDSRVLPAVEGRESWPRSAVLVSHSRFLDVLAFFKMDFTLLLRAAAME